MQIGDYFNEILFIISESPFVESKNLSFEERPPDAAYVSGTIIFIDGSTLHFKEYIIFKTETIKYLKYAYHYLHEDKSIFFRYDNALDPKIKNLSTYPEHKHTSKDYLPARRPALRELLKEISNLIKTKE